MQRPSAQDLSKFIQPGRVHRSLYTDSALFELEMQRDAWLGLMAKRPGPCAEGCRMTPDTRSLRTSPIIAHDRLGVRQCEDFLVHEARLLDEARFDEWIALFTEDACYWVPQRAGSSQSA